MESVSAFAPLIEVAQVKIQVKRRQELQRSIELQSSSVSEVCRTVAVMLTPWQPRRAGARTYDFA